MKTLSSTAQLKWVFAWVKKLRGTDHGVQGSSPLWWRLCAGFLLVAPAAWATGLDWTSHQILRDTNYVVAVDAAMDTNEVVHVIYARPGPNPDLYYFQYADGTNTPPELVYDGSISNTINGWPKSPAIALTPDGKPIIIFGVHEASASRISQVKMAIRFNPGGWSFWTLETWNNHQSAPKDWDVAVATNNYAYLAYASSYGVTCKGVDLATYDWSPHVLYTNLVGEVEVAVDALGHPHVAHSLHQDLTYGILSHDWDGAGWVTSTGGTRYTYHLALAADPARPQVWLAYENGSGGNKLRYRSFNGLSWLDDTPPIEPSAINSLALAVNNDGSLRMAVAENNAIAYITRSYPAGSWDSQEIDYSYGWPLAIMLTAEDEPRIVSGTTLGISGGWNIALHEYSAPHPAFTGSPIWGPAPLTVQFTNQSEGTIRGMRWDFGDGGYSTEEHPAHIYAQQGNYTVVLTVSNATETAEYRQDDYIAVQKWFIEDIEEPAVLADETPGFGLLPGDLPCFSVYGNITDRLVYAYFDGSNWVGEVVDTASYAGHAGNSLVVNADGEPCVAYRTGVSPCAMNFAQRNAGAWQRETIDADIGSDGTVCSLALENGGTPRVAYAAGGEVRYAARQGSTWTPEVVSGVSNLYTEPALALDGAGAPHIAYGDVATNGGYSLFHARKPSGFWQVDIVATGTPGVAAPGYGASIVMDSFGRPCISYLEKQNNAWYNLMYARQTGTGWMFQVVANIGERYMSPLKTSLRLAAGDRARIAFFHQANNALGYAEETSEGWDIETVDNQSSSVGGHPALLLDSNDSPRIGYVDRANLHLKWAKSDQPPVLVASFEASPTYGTAPKTVNFTDRSQGAVLTWSWVFGDGASSTAQNPSHAYLTNGSYEVALTVTDALGSNTMTVPAAVVLEPLGSGFSADPVRGPAPLEVQFISEATGDVQLYSWTFGDGGNSSETNPVHQYVAAGDYTVSLQVGVPVGGTVWNYKTETKTNYIHVGELGAGFSAGPLEGYEPLAVTFTNQSYGTITNQLWNFGDGETSGQESPAHIYATSGVFDVSLAVHGPEGSNTLTQQGYITVHAGLHADFDGWPVAGSAPLQVAFTNRSQGAITWQEWAFGDGESSSEAHPIHTYASNGIYDVALSVGNASATNRLVQSNYVRVSDFEVDQTSPAEGDWAVNYSTNVRVRFSIEATNVSQTTFLVEAVETDGVWSVVGSVQEVDTRTYEFVPDAGLPTGVTVRVTIKGGDQGVRSRVGGAALPGDYVWRFQTYPHVRLKVIQVCEDQEEYLLARKATLVRAWVGAFQTGQVDTAITASLSAGGAPVLAPMNHTVKSGYNMLEQKEGYNTVNFFIPANASVLTGGLQVLQATLAPTDAAAQARAGDCANHYCAMDLNPSTNVFTVEFVACNEGAWTYPMTPAQLRDYTRAAIAHSDFLKATYPVTETTYRPIISGTEVKLHSWSPAIAFVGAFRWKYYILHLDRRAKADPNIDMVVGIMATGELAGASGLSRGTDVEGVLVDADPKTYFATAHEIMHRFGRYLGNEEDYLVHGPYGLGADAGWWVDKGVAGCITNCSANRNSSYDVYPWGVTRNGRRVWKEFFFNYMGDASVVAWWTRREDYAFLYGRIAGPVSKKTPRDEVVATGVDGEDGMTYALISGQMWSNGVVTMDPIVQSPDLGGETPEDFSTEYVAQISGPGYLRSYGFAPIMFPEDDQIQLAFSFIVHVPTNINRILIMSSGVPLADLNASTYAPLSQLLWPNGGETISGVVTVSWDSIDFDVNTLTHSLYFSPNGGASWNLVALDITNSNNFVWDTFLCPGTTNGLLKILASDGFHTVEDVSDAPFAVLCMPPQVFINQPGDNEEISEDGLTLQALVYDPDGQPMEPSVVQWVSDQDGLLGRGAVLEVPHLSYGFHQVFCEVVNSRGRTGVSESVRIDVCPLMVGCAPDNNGARLAWFARTNEVYRVLRSPDALADWAVCSNLLDASGALLPANILGQGANLSVITTNRLPVQPLFYRIEVEAP